MSESFDVSTAAMGHVGTVTFLAAAVTAFSLVPFVDRVLSELSVGAE